MIDKLAASSGLQRIAEVKKQMAPTEVKRLDQPDRGGFSQVIGEVLETASASAAKSRELNRRLQMNDPTVTLEQATIASNVSNIQFTAVVQLRSKLVQAYTDIMNLPV